MRHGSDLGQGHTARVNSGDLALEPVLFILRPHGSDSGPLGVLELPMSPQPCFTPCLLSLPPKSLILYLPPNFRSRFMPCLLLVPVTSSESTGGDLTSWLWRPEGAETKSFCTISSSEENHATTDSLGSGIPQREVQSWATLPEPLKFSVLSCLIYKMGEKRELALKRCK